jgi:hypothetical protein
MITANVNSSRMSADMSNNSQHSQRFPLLEKLIQRFNGDRSPALLMFGDSVALRAADDDPNKQSLEEMVIAGMGESGACCIADSAFHSQVFSLFCNCLSRLRNRPKIVVIPINLRSFSLSWDLHPDYQFLWETAKLDDFARDVDISREPIFPTPVARAIFNAVPIQLLDLKMRTIGDFYEIIAARTDVRKGPEWHRRIENIFTLHYLYRLYPNHRKLRYFGTAIKTLRRANINAFLYITPINHKAGYKYAGSDFTACVTDNIQIIKKYLAEFGVNAVNAADLDYDLKSVNFPSLADFSFDCEESDFFTIHNATEHLKCTARKRLAERIVKLSKILGLN